MKSRSQSKRGRGVFSKILQHVVQAPKRRAVVTSAPKRVSSARLRFGPFGQTRARGKAVVPVAAVAPPAVPVAVMPAPAVPSPAPARDLERTLRDLRHADLTTEEFARPSETLRGQIEGFLLDQSSEHTQRAYSKDLKRFVKYLLVRLDRNGPEPLNRLVFVGYKDWLLAEGLEHTTIDRHLSTLRGLFRWLTEEGLLQRNPAERIRFLNPKRLSRTEGFTDNEVRRVLEMPNLHTRVGAQHYAILMMLFYVGLRRSELCSLRTTNFSVESGRRVIKIRGKGNRERVIPLVRAVWNGLVHYFVIARRDPGVDQWLFSPIRNNRTGTVNRALDPSSIFYVVKKYAKMAGIQKRVSPHSCRATAISNARDHNVPDRAIQEYAGWASPDMITRYDKRKTAVEKSAALAIRYGLDAPRPEAAEPESSPPSSAN